MTVLNRESGRRTAAREESSEQGLPGPPAAFDIEIFYDGGCPLCTREVALLRRLDRRGRVRFTDITAEGFDAASAGVPWGELMDRIHGRLSDGTLVEGVEVFRRVYTAVGYGALVAPTRLPGIAHLLDLAYRLFAKNRRRLTGRCRGGACEPGPKPSGPCVGTG
ncbi:MAG: thiol-disulfide oxidoreductase DCC family protein [Acidithiobacillales bacterium]